MFNSFGQNAGYVEDLYQLYLANPKLVGSYWEDYFNRVRESLSEQNFLNGAALGLNDYLDDTVSTSVQTITRDESVSATENFSVFALVEAYRQWGHLRAKVNPIQKLCKACEAPNFLASFNNLPSDEALVSSFGLSNSQTITFAELKKLLEKTYSGSIGFEFTHIENSIERAWLQEKIEARNNNQFSIAELKDFLKFLAEAEIFESQLHRTFVGQKRFSLEGGETVIPMVKAILDKGAQLSLEDVCIGMAHRGRLTMLHKICGKPLPKLFSEFEDRTEFAQYGSGDVKYHLGHSTKFKTTSGKEILVDMAVNPSHLEFVDPVVVGMVRARQEKIYQANPTAALGLLLHGDAAFIGQGVVTETLNMSNVAAYTTYGTIHIIINNQVGFTTGSHDARSSRYSSDFAKAIGAPVLHINSEDVEAACWASELAIEYRQKFGKDIVLDLYCYRKHGHNEADEPSFTQPTIYAELKNKDLLSDIFQRKIAERGIEHSELENIRSAAIAEFNSWKSDVPAVRNESAACAAHGKLFEKNIQTAVDTEVLKNVAATLLKLPADFTLHPKLDQLIKKRVQAVNEESNIEWGLAEALAFGSLVTEGYSIRLTGQDCGRGTFNHRHLVYHEYNTDELFLPLKQLGESNTQIDIHNSTLSEAAVLAFEYGYSLSTNKTLTLWEAQFGDFANGAQVIIDQFLSSSEQKWGVLSGVVMLLPHGYEGQGPEHSSARLERFLQLCADGNMTVCYPTNSAQYFHMIRQQAKREIQRPLVVMTPKSLLRAADAMSDLKDFSTGQFQPVLADNFGKQKAKNVIFTTGKIAYELIKQLKQDKTEDALVIRIEQLYPFPETEIISLLKDIKKAKFIWLQEEPQNMGAWTFIEPRLRKLLQAEIHYCGRSESASPSTGSHHFHGIEQKSCINQVLQAMA